MDSKVCGEPDIKINHASYNIIFSGGERVSVLKYDLGAMPH